VHLPVKAYAILGMCLALAFKSGVEYGEPCPMYQADAYNEADVTFLSFLIPYQSQFLTVFFILHAEIRTIQYLITGEE